MDVRITAKPVFERTGLWCDDCALPSVIEVLFGVLTERGSLIGTEWVSECVECGRDA